MHVHDDPDSRRSILDDIADRSGVRPRVSLPDGDSDHGGSPVVDPASPATRLVPEGRGNYKLLGQIARGGMSVILKGHDTDLGRDIAVKVLDETLAQRPEVVQRFVEEAQIGGQLQHPGIVPVYELGLMADERPYFTMKLVKGRTLAALFRDRSTPNDGRGRLLGIFHSACQTVAYAHSKGVIHRDLKPANIMVGAFGEVQVVDWGLAKVLGHGGVEDEKLAPTSCAAAPSAIETIRSGPESEGSDSMVGSVMGTPAYMPPEQAQGETEKLDERADVFALGAVLCELLTGSPPYVKWADDAVVVQAANADLDRARTRLAECGADPALVSLCLDCLRPARAARPANADKVAQALGDYLASTEARAHEAELAAAEARVRAGEERRARRLTLALAAAIALALFAGGGAYLWIQRTEFDRAETTRLAVEEAQAESSVASREGRAEAALSLAQRALSLAETGSADAALLTRARAFVNRAQVEAEAERRELEQVERDQALLARLEAVRLEQVDRLGDDDKERELDQAFARAFRDYGVDLEVDDLLPALAHFRERRHRRGDRFSLSTLGADSAAPTRNRVSRIRPACSTSRWTWTPTPDRIGVREAIAERDLDSLLVFAQPGRVETLESNTVLALAWAIWSLFPEPAPRSVRHLRPGAASIHPEEYVLQTMAGRLFHWSGRWADSLVARSAALGQRPGDIDARSSVAESYLFLGRLLEGERVARLAVEADPEHFDASYMHAMTLIQLGRYHEALEPLDRCRELRGMRSVRADLLWTRYFAGTVDTRELIEALEDPVDSLGLATITFALVHQPDAVSESAKRVLAALDLHRGGMAQGNWVWARAYSGVHGARGLVLRRRRRWKASSTVSEFLCSRPPRSRSCEESSTLGWVGMTWRGSPSHAVRAKRGSSSATRSWAGNARISCVGAPAPGTPSIGSVGEARELRGARAKTRFQRLESFEQVVGAPLDGACERRVALDEFGVAAIQEVGDHEPSGRVQAPHGAGLVDLQSKREHVLDRQETALAFQLGESEAPERPGIVAALGFGVREEPLDVPRGSVAQPRGQALLAPEALMPSCGAPGP